MYIHTSCRLLRDFDFRGQISYTHLYVYTHTIRMYTQTLSGGILVADTVRVISISPPRFHMHICMYIHTSCRLLRDFDFRGQISYTHLYVYTHTIRMYTQTLSGGILVADTVRVISISPPRFHMHICMYIHIPYAGGGSQGRSWVARGQLVGAKCL